MPYLASRQTKLHDSAKPKVTNKLFMTLLPFVIALSIMFFIGATLMGWITL